MQVIVTGAGELQLVDDEGQVYPPLAIDEVQFLNNAIPAAQVVVGQIPLSEALDDISNALASGDSSAAVTVAGPNVGVSTSDPDTFARLAEQFDIDPDSGVTSFTVGTVTVALTMGT